MISAKLVMLMRSRSALGRLADAEVHEMIKVMEELGFKIIEPAAPAAAPVAPVAPAPVAPAAPAVPAPPVAQ